MSTSLTTSAMASARISRSSLWRAIVYPPHGQVKAWSMLIVAPHTQTSDIPSSGRPYRIAMPSLKSDFVSIDAVSLVDGAVVIQLDTPFSPAISTSSCCGAESLGRSSWTCSLNAAAF